MSKVKTPQQKKRLSYQHDRRNTYGENQKSSRKNIPRSKQLSHQDERRSVRQALLAVEGAAADEVADEAQSQALRKGRMKKLRAFRKSPDRPLGEVVARQLQRRRAKMTAKQLHRLAVADRASIFLAGDLRTGLTVGQALRAGACSASVLENAICEFSGSDCRPGDDGTAAPDPWRMVPANAFNPKCNLFHMHVLQLR